MGSSLTFRIYKGASPAEFRALAEHAAVSVAARLQWDAPGEGDAALYLHGDGLVHTLFIPYQNSDFLFCNELGRQSRLPWMELRIHESSLWDYSLFQGEKVTDQFSPWPEFWEDPEAPSFRDYKARHLGSPRILSESWRIPIEQIERYLVQWDPDYLENPAKTKAYPHDRFPYGNYNQVYDILTALGAHDPRSESGHHTLILPEGT